MLDYLTAIPEKGLGCELRVFCLRLNEKIIILGNGGIKYKNLKKISGWLSPQWSAEEMQKISAKLSYSLSNYSTTIYTEKVYTNS